MTIDFVNPTAAGFCPQRLERLRSWLQEQVSGDKLAGASILVARHGVPVFCEAAGLAELSTGQPFTTETIVRLYSMTKAVTTVAAMMCYEEGHFFLDDPVAKFLPEFRSTPVWSGGSITDVVPQSTPMTVRHLMTHTSGLTYGFMNTNVVDKAYRKAEAELPTAGATLRDWIEKVASLPLICQPGTAWNYSVSTDVLGRLVEVWSGKSLEAYFNEHILGPLRMRDTGFHVRPENAHRLAACYNVASGGGMASIAVAPTKPALDAPPRRGLKLQDAAATSQYLKPATHFSGGGGLTGTLTDYGRFCQMLLNGGELEGNRLLSPKTVAYMRTNQLPDDCDMAAMGQPVWSETSYEGIGFGLGFAVVLDPVKANIIASPGEHHWGGAASTFFWIDPVEDMYVVFCTQLMPSSTYPIRRELRARVYQALVE